MLGRRTLSTMSHSCGNFQQVSVGAEHICAVSNTGLLNVGDAIQQEKPPHRMRHLFGSLLARILPVD